MKYLMFAGLLALSLVACGGEGTTAETSEETTGGETSYAGPLLSEDVAAGETVWNSFCTGCHSAEGHGPNLTEHAHSAAQIRETIREGDGGMPAFSTERLSDQQVEDVLAFLNSVGAVSQ